MTTLDRLKESYKKLSNGIGYYYTDGMHYEEDGDEIYELKFTCMGLGPRNSFTYAFRIDGDPFSDEVELEREHSNLGFYSVYRFNTISDFVRMFNAARSDRETVLQFINWLEELKNIRR